MAELKTKVTTASVIDFIKSVKDEKKRKDAMTLLSLFKKVTGEKPRMWGETGTGPRRKGGGPTGTSRGRANSQQRIMRGPSIIGFGKYHYKSERSSQEGDWPLTGFSPRKQNLTLYVMPGMSELKPLLTKLGKHKKSAGCLYINKLEDVDPKVLESIIRKGFVMMKKKYRT